MLLLAIATALPALTVLLLIARVDGRAGAWMYWTPVAVPLGLGLSSVT